MSMVIQGHSIVHLLHYGGILMMDFHGILRKDSCNTNSRQTWEGFVRGDWPQNDGVVLVMKRHYPSQRVFLNPSLGQAMMIWFRGYPTVLVLTNHSDARAPSKSSLGRFLQASVRTMTPHLQQAASGDVWRLCRQNGGENYGIISGWRICTIDSCRIGTQDWVKV